MASLKCSKCGFGIHYNSEPSGIEYIFIKKEDWEIICSSSFDSENKEMDEQGKYPKLFKSDTIEEDFPFAITKVWKCPGCDSVFLFDEKGTVIKSYQKTDKIFTGESICEVIVFDDFSWDKITELGIPNKKLVYENPSFYAKVYEDGILISKNKEYTDTVCAYEKL